MHRLATRVLAFGLPLSMSLIAAAATPTGTTAAAAPAAQAAPSAPSGGTATSAPGPAIAAPTTAPSSNGAATPKGGDSAGEKPMDGSTYTVRLRDLEQRVDELKDQIRRSHTRLALLSDTIMGGGQAGCRADILFHDEMSGAFRLVRAVFLMDGQIQYNRQDDTGVLAEQKEIPIYSGSVAPGDHTISVLLNFQGNGFGVFTYLRGFKFELKSSHSFTAVDGKSVSVTATALEKGGVTTPLDQRPAVEWHEKTSALGAGAGAAAAAAPAAGTPAAGGGGAK